MTVVASYVCRIPQMGRPVYPRGLPTGKRFQAILEADFLSSALNERALPSHIHYLRSPHRRKAASTSFSIASLSAPDKACSAAFRTHDGSRVS